MPHMTSSIPSTVFYGSMFLKPLHIARLILRISDFIPRASDLFSRMMAQGGDRATLTKQLSKEGLSLLPDCFSKIW